MKRKKIVKGKKKGELVEVWEDRGPGAGVQHHLPTRVGRYLATSGGFPPSRTQKF
jgi:hypothetical protein